MCMYVDVTHTSGWFVQEEDLWVTQKAQSHTETSLHPPTVRLDRITGHLHRKYTSMNIRTHIHSVRVHFLAVGSLFRLTPFSAMHSMQPTNTCMDGCGHSSHSSHMTDCLPGKQHTNTIHVPHSAFKRHSYTPDLIRGFYFLSVMI